MSGPNLVGLTVTLLGALIVIAGGLTTGYGITALTGLILLLVAPIAAALARGS